MAPASVNPIGCASATSASTTPLSMPWRREPSSTLSSLEDHLGLLVGLGRLDAGDEADRPLAIVVGDEHVVQRIFEKAAGAP
jgi:hypothetical protein